ncbi:hypothetical protein [Actinoplanes rectilineatus]|uniref:hypothetical protein n=1 Tax=Actinoplanes rectilineatus TaxID=113571 RepID=UPI0005F29F77|nr:hypothetical protein [Actinoplanes rectilineatus]
MTYTYIGADRNDQDDNPDRCCDQYGIGNHDPVNCETGPAPAVKHVITVDPERDSEGNYTQR